jgi:hypothetical protein
MTQATELSFQQIENSLVVLSKGGVYTQHEAYLRRGEVFAKMGSGYVGLRRSGTSKPGVNLIDYDLGSEHTFMFTRTGKIVTEGHPRAYSECTGVHITTALPEPTEEVSPKKRSSKK